MISNEGNGQENETNNSKVSTMIYDNHHLLDWMLPTICLFKPQSIDSEKKEEIQGVSLVLKQSISLLPTLPVANFAQSDSAKNKKTECESF